MFHLEVFISHIPKAKTSLSVRHASVFGWRINVNFCLYYNVCNVMPTLSASHYIHDVDESMSYVER